MVWELIPMIASAAGQAYTAGESADMTLEQAMREAELGREGIAQQREQFDLMNRLLLPFYTSGANQLPSLQRRTMEQDLDSLRERPAIQQLLQDTRQDTRDQLSTIGARRSGYGLRQIGSAESDALSGIEQLLTGRKQSLAGQSQTTGSSLASLGNQNVNAITQLLSGVGNAQAQGILGNQAINAQFAQNMGELGAGIADYYR